MEIAKHRRRQILRAALGAYKALLKTAKKHEENAGVDTSGTDELLAYVEYLEEENIDIAAVNRDSLLGGTPMGDLMASQLFKDDDGTPLTADMLGEWMRRVALCFAPFNVVATWDLQNRKWVAAWLRAIDANTADAMKADTTLTKDMALDLPHAVASAPQCVDASWFREQVPLDALTDEGVGAQLALIGCQAPPDAITAMDNQTRVDVFHFVQDVRGGRPAVRPKAVDLEWFHDDLRAAIESGTKLALEERQDAPVTAPAAEEDADAPMDEQVVAAWVIAGPWSVGEADGDDYPLVWDAGSVTDKETAPLHPFVYDLDKARQVAAKLNREWSREQKGAAEPDVIQDVLDTIAEDATDPADLGAGADVEEPPRGKKKRLQHKKKDK